VIIDTAALQRRGTSRCIYCMGCRLFLAEKA